MTDVYAGIALTRETSEVSLMSLPPRDLKKEPLVRWQLIAYSYLFYGTLESIVSSVAYIMYMNSRGPHMVPNPVPADDRGDGSFPAGYSPLQLVFAWNWGVDAQTDDYQMQTGNLGTDNDVNASLTASSVFFFIVLIVVCQWGHLISVRRSSPYFSDCILDTQKRGGSLLYRLKMELMETTPKLPIVLVLYNK